MVGPKPSSGSVRPPAVAGRFYPVDPGACSSLVATFLDPLAHLADVPPAEHRGPGRWMGGVVPHAGWVCSGAIAGLTIGTLARSIAKPDVVVIFGAVHTPVEVDFAALDSHAAWALPGDQANVAHELRSALVATGSGRRFVVEDSLHAHEHAVEVELPFVRAAWPDATVLPVEVPLVDDAAIMGASVARMIAAMGQRAVYLASSDLTHYGPSYRFAPAGVGLHGLTWAKGNDKRLLDLVVDGRIGQVVAEVRSHANACGGGAIAAMMAACEASIGSGALCGKVLRHASSYETLAEVYPQPPVDAVGYAAVVVGW